MSILKNLSNLQVKPLPHFLSIRGINVATPILAQ
jgi:hypothetical protein